MIESNFTNFKKRELRLMSTHARIFRQYVNSYDFNLENYEQRVYDPLYFFVPNLPAALDFLTSLGLLFPPESSLSRKKYFEQYQDKKIGACPEGYRLALYFLIDNQMAEAVL